MSFAKLARKVLCIGRNYADHASELGNAVPKIPFFFLKPPSSALLAGQGPILRPKGTSLHYELELAVILSKQLKNEPGSFDKQSAVASIKGYALALDMTARNVQDEAKSKGLPWSIAKGFDTFLPLSELVLAPHVTDFDNLTLEFKVNGEVRQNDSTELMIFKIPKILSYCSNIMTLEEDDIILTGTPKGVGELVPGDKVEGRLLQNGKELARIETHVEEKDGYYEFKK